MPPNDKLTLTNLATSFRDKSQRVFFLFFVRV